MGNSESSRDECGETEVIELPFRASQDAEESAILFKLVIDESKSSLESEIQLALIFWLTIGFLLLIIRRILTRVEGSLHTPTPVLLSIWVLAIAVGFGKRIVIRVPVVLALVSVIWPVSKFLAIIH